MSRTVVLHYHLFKNAGTSLDSILKQNLGDRWVTAEFPMGGDNNTALVENWIRTTPDALAFSSHTMAGPLPRVEGVRIVPILLLRDPIARIKSAYNFERNQVSDSRGAKLAKEGDFRHYVETRLSRPADRQCRNFHAHRLASLVSGPEPELVRAMSALSLLAVHGVVGIVEKFDQTIAGLAGKLKDDFPPLKWEQVRENVSKKASAADDPEIRLMLVNSNRDDLELHMHAMSTFDLMLNFEHD